MPLKKYKTITLSIEKIMLKDKRKDNKHES